MHSLRWKIAGHGVALLATVLVGGLLSAMLVRFTPGFDSDERELDPHLNAQSIQILHDARHHDDNIFRFYLSYMKRAATGDLGSSIALNQPVRRLLRQRIPLTVQLLGTGLALAWLLSLGLSTGLAWFRFSVYDTLTTALSGTLLCLPAAVLALLSVLWNVPGSIAIALIVFPHTYRYARNLLVNAYSRPNILAARARGLSETHILFWHISPTIAPQLLALAGVSLSMAIGATIPVEALCGLPGIGQLAWQAALARDLPLLVNITILVTLVTLLANSAADVIGHMFRRQEV
jgi:peptide/nickel transport system permease protein